MTLAEAKEHLQGEFWDWLSTSPAGTDKDMEALEVLFSHAKNPELSTMDMIHLEEGA